MMNSLNKSIWGWISRLYQDVHILWGCFLTSSRTHLMPFGGSFSLHFILLFFVKLYGMLCFFNVIVLKFTCIMLFVRHALQLHMLAIECLLFPLNSSRKGLPFSSYNLWLYFFNILFPDWHLSSTCEILIAG